MASIWLYPTVDELARKEFDLDSIVSGKTYEPIGIKDLNNYCQNVEHSAENLHFYLWFLQYKHRFYKLSPDQRALSPPPPAPPAKELKIAKSSSTLATLCNDDGKEAHPGLHSVYTIHDEINTKNLPGFCPAPPSPSSTPCPSFIAGPPSIADSDPWSFSDMSENTQRSTDMLLDSRTPEARKQPFRDDFDRVICTCIIADSPKELNVPSAMRATLLANAELTTHPDVFAPAAQHIYSLIATTTYPNFLKHACSNSNKPRQVFAVTLTTTLFLTGVAIGTWMIATGVPRPYRLFSILCFFLAALIGGFRGGCVCIYGLGYRRQLRPDELWMDTESRNLNPPKYFYLRVFEKEVKIEDAKLRKIFDKIFLNAVVGATVFGAIMAAIFMSVPSGHL
ncbi:hypothetical protein HK104_003745 [Borealophlyctis nickersoniae]|nr:hypothetical protein HK104_003745 [Borealophlyctis nickersoniae]